MELKNEIVKIETTQLEEVVKNSGLALNEGEEIKTAYLPFLVRLSEIQDQATKINFNEPTELDEKISRELRLATVKVRTDAEKLKDEQKRVDLLRGKVKQDSYNLIASSCKLAEEVFFNVEKAREIAEKKRKEQLKIDRSEKLEPYCDAVSLYPLGEMSEEQFSELYAALRSSHEMKLEAERKAEEARLAEIEAEKKRQEEIRLENERLKKEAIEKERLAEIERQKQAAILKAEQEKAAKERAELMAKAEAERKEKERLEAEMKTKKEAEEKAQREASAKIEAEKKAKALAEKNAKLAPDKDKLLAFGQSINDLPRPDIKSIEAAVVMSQINGLLVKLNNYIVTEANKL